MLHSGNKTRGRGLECIRQATSELESKPPPPPPNKKIGQNENIMEMMTSGDCLEADGPSHLEHYTALDKVIKRHWSSALTVKFAYQSIIKAIWKSVACNDVENKTFQECNSTSLWETTTGVMAATTQKIMVCILLLSISSMVLSISGSSHTLLQKSCTVHLLSSLGISCHSLSSKDTLFGTTVHQMSAGPSSVHSCLLHQSCRGQIPGSSSASQWRTSTVMRTPGNWLSLNDPCQTFLKYMTRWDQWAGLPHL